MAKARKIIPAETGRELIQISIKFDRSMLGRIDRQATNVGTNRTAFISMAVGEKLIQLENACTPQR